MDLQIPPLQIPQIDARQPAEQTDIKKAAQDFEASYLGTTFSAMLEEALPNPAGGHGEEMFRSVLANEMAQEIAKAGGIGIAQTIEAQLKEYIK